LPIDEELPMADCRWPICGSEPDEELKIADCRLPICGSEPDDERPIEAFRMPIGGSEQAQETPFSKAWKPKPLFFSNVWKKLLVSVPSELKIDLPQIGNRQSTIANS